jgi:competence protein ComEA
VAQAPPLVLTPVVAGQAQSAPPEPPLAETDSAAEEIVVSVIGMVRAPGIVRLPPGSRVADALAAAGGARAGADTSSLNLAQRLSDGDQISVAAPGESAEAPPPNAAGGSGVSGPGASQSGSAAGESALVNLNTATQAELEGLPGIGPVMAGSIISWRDAHGRFTSIEQLSEVDGIGPTRLEKPRPLVTL